MAAALTVSSAYCVRMISIMRVVINILVDCLVERDTDTGRALDDVKELAKGEHEEPEDNRHLVGQRDKPVELSSPPERRGGERQAGNADCKEQDQGEQVKTETLCEESPISFKRRQKAIASPTMSSVALTSSP